MMRFGLSSVQSYIFLKVLSNASGFAASEGTVLRVTVSLD